MGCRHSSSSPPGSPKITIKHRGPLAIKNKLFNQHSQKFTQQKSVSIKPSSSTRILSSLNLEQTLDGHGKNLVKRLEFHSACLLFDLSSTHILLLNQGQLHSIHLHTITSETYDLPNDNMNIQEIVWSTQLNTFLILTTDQLYQTSVDPLQLTPIHQIQFINEGHRQSYMTVNGDDLLINRSFGHDLRRYSLSKCTPMKSPHVHKEDRNLCITTIRLNSNKVLALAISMADKQIIDLVHLNTDQRLRRVQLDFNENISYPIDLHFNGLWFAKTSIPYVNIGHCLISSDGQMIRLKLFSDEDNFIRSLRLSYDNNWLLIGRQHALEIYSLTSSSIPLL